MSAQDPTRLRLAGRYRLERRLGSGRTATVWRAWDELLARPVAVKVLSVSLLPDLALRARLGEETGAVVGLSHPGIVAVHDFGEASVPGGRSTPYLVMEFLDGESLASRLRRGPLPPGEASRLCGEVASALAFAHSAGLVHQNLRPADIFLTADGAKVLGFGTAKAMYGLAGFSALGLFEPPGPPDTSSYTAPEQLGGEEVTPAADVYALGTILAEALVGRRARDVPLSSDVPAGLARLCVRCLATDPASRPSAAEVAELLAVSLSPSAAEVAELLAVSAWPSAAGEVPDPPTLDEVDPGNALTTWLLDEPPGGRDRPGEPPRRGRLDRPARTQRRLDEAARLRRCRQFAIDAIAAVIVLFVVLSLARNSLRHPDLPAPLTARAAAPALTVGARRVSPQEGLLNTLRRTVGEGVADGEIRSDVGADLAGLVTGLQRELASGRSVDLARRVAGLRAEIARCLREGGVTESRAARLNAVLSAVRA